MELQTTLEKRRALRSLGKVEITTQLIEQLAGAARLAPSCFNKQPWRYVFIYEKESLERIFSALSSGNKWAQKASMMIAVVSKPDLDCVIGDRQYYQFDTGMATALLMLKATELGLVAHPMAGFNPQKAAEVLGIPDDMWVITLMAVGRRVDSIDPELNDQQRGLEKQRPERLAFDRFVYHNQFSQ